MKHPIIDSRRNFIYYLIAWLIISLLHLFLIGYYFDFPFAAVLADAVVSNLLVSVLGLSLWFSLRYGMGNKERSIIKSIVIHSVSALVLLSLWLAFTYLVLQLIFQENTAYFDFFNDSLIYRFIGGLFLYSILVLFYYLMIYYQNIKEKSANENRLNMLIKEAEIESLKTQLNPHFLFNSLNSISSLTIQKPEKAQEMVILLSELLRYSVNGSNHSFVPIKKEIDTLMKYVDIEKIRYGEKLKVVFENDEKCNDFQLPPLILQPLIENAIKYSRGQSGGDSYIEVKINNIDSKCKIEISNDYDSEYVNDAGEGIGLKNIRRRLEIIYEDNFSFNTMDNGKRFTAEMILPKNN